MSIIRGPIGPAHYVVVQNALVRDRRLSFRARGLLVHLLSMPPGWKTSSARLVRETTEGRDAIRTAIRELEQAGYVRHSRRQDERGRWASEWIVYDTPCGQDGDNDHCPTPENPTPETQAPKEVPITEVLRKELSEMLRDLEPIVCTTCNGTTWHVPHPVTRPNHLERCTTCTDGTLRAPR